MEYVLICSGPTAICLCPSLTHLTTQLVSSPGVTKPGPVGPDCLTEISRKQSRPLPILVTIESICFDHDSLLSRVKTQQFSLFNLLNSHITPL